MPKFIISRLKEVGAEAIVNMAAAARMLNYSE